MKKVEFAIFTGKCVKGVEIFDGDLVFVNAQVFPSIHYYFCFFQNIICQENVDYVELKHIDGMKVRVPLNMISALEIIARKDTRQYEILIEVLTQNCILRNKLNRIKKNFAQLLCEE